MSTFLFSRSDSTAKFTVWKFDPHSDQVFSKVDVDPSFTLEQGYQLASVGGYLLSWGPNQKNAPCFPDGFPFELLELITEPGKPFSMKAIQKGALPPNKFWGYRGHYSSNPDEQKTLPLISMGNFLMFFVGGKGRGTYTLYNFDPKPSDPLNPDPIPSGFTPQGGFPSIHEGHKLVNFGNYVLDRFPDGSTYRIWNFDPQNTVPLSIPEVNTGEWKGVTSAHKVIAVGKKLLTWIPGELGYSLWSVDPFAKNPFTEEVCGGTLPAEFKSGSDISSFESLEEIKVKDAPAPGTMDFMRTKIKKVVYYMVESRSFDNVCGWLYENDLAKINYIGSDKPFEGASSSNTNPYQGKSIPQSKYQNGALSDQWDLKAESQDPFHDTSDGLSQMFNDEGQDYAKREKPNMEGFVENNSNPEVMLSFTPNQLPVLNGLANNFAISDEWFSSVPGGTDINRSFSVTGSAMNRLDTWEGGSIYANWADYPHRPSIWKILYNNGIKDWKIFNVIDWLGKPFTYHLYLEGQVPSIDAKPTRYINSLNTFKMQARYGELPSFSFLEPIWIAPVGTTSYHPKGDMVPAEIQLNEIYEAIKNGPNWEDTLLVITFSKNGGLYDHVAPPYAAKPFANDGVDGFEFDLLGPRVPTIMVSPWIKENTVIRSGEETPFDSTSFAATLLKWYGVPKSRWGMGDRMDQAPTFEAVFRESAPRKDKPEFEPPFDKSFPNTES